ncbi:Ger(x)C family spore germination protein [Alkalihalobacillus macyae]|uniref:Ger(x)C family spore germination protein n=1 Tax=Guptibacillus hwajinpoensis TaxID=208199 RepID=UPI00273AFFC6|nr:Ger(x)C family spore germination protein [Alkalihalobacillus macyae]MDP4551152.1 Ger(x)C family spore germination protein [Alkalihalobacillus macyae]
MTYKAFIIVFLMGSMIVLTGCWGRTELQDLDIVTAIGIDKGGEEVDNRYRVTVQIVNEGQISGGAQTGGAIKVAPVTTYSNTGSTVFEALRKIAPKTANELYFPHIQMIAIGEELATDGVKDLFDFLERDHQFRVLFPILVVREDTAENLLRISTPLEPLPSAKIIGGLEFTKKIWGEYATTRADQVILHLGSKGTGTITGVQINGNVEDGNQLSNIEQISPKTEIEIRGIAVFKEGKFIKWLDDDIARGATWINNELSNTIVNLDCKSEKDSIAIQIMRSKTSLKASIKDKKPVLSISVREEGHLSEVHCPMDLNQFETINKLEKELANETKEEIKLAMKAAQEEKSDIFGLGEVVNREDPTLWKEIEGRWDEEFFPELEFNVKVKAFIRRTGMRTKPYLNTE